MPIPLKEAVTNMHKLNPDGTPVRFQIVFFTKDGKRVELPDATRCSLPPGMRGQREFIGINPNIKGRHYYAVHQKLITQFNKINTVY